MGLAAGVLVGIFGLLLFAFLDQRATNDELLDAFDRQSKERREVLSRLLEGQAERTRQLLLQISERATEQRRELRRNLREVLRQLGGDPSAIPPASSERREEPSDRGPGGNPRDPNDPDPDPSPSPSPSDDDPLICVPAIEICIEDGGLL